METGGHPPDSAGSARLASGRTLSQFAPEVVRALFPVFDQTTISFVCSSTLPSEAGSIPCQTHLDGIEEPFFMSEYLAAFGHAKISHSFRPEWCHS